MRLLVDNFNKKTELEGSDFMRNRSNKYALIQQAKTEAKMRKQIKQITPCVYAGIALALHRKCG